MSSALATPGGGGLPAGVTIDNDPLLGANSATRLPTQQAVHAYAIAAAFASAKIGGLGVFTHSYGELGGNDSFVDRFTGWPRRVAAALGIPASETTITGMSGAQCSSPSVGDTDSAGVGQVMRWWHPDHVYSSAPQARVGAKAQARIALFMLGINDPVRDFTVWATFGRTASKHGLRTIAARARTRAIYYFDDATITYTGTWATVATNQASKGNVKRTSTNGDFATWIIPKTFRGGTIDFVVHANLNGSVANLPTNGARLNWTGTSSINGAAAFNLSGQGTGGTRIQATYRFTFTKADAGKTVIATLASANAGETFDFDSIAIEDDDHPGVGLINQPTNFPYASTAGFFATADGPQFNSDLASVAAEFATGTVYVVDVATQMDALYNGTIISGGAADAVNDHAGQVIHFKPLDAAQCLVDVNSLMRLSAGEEFLVTAIVKTSNVDWQLTGIRNVTAATTSDCADSPTTNVTSFANSAMGDCLPWNNDRVHPSDYGHWLIARLVLASMANWQATAGFAAASGGYRLSDRPHPPSLDAFYCTLGGTRTTLVSANSVGDRAYATRVEILDDGDLLALWFETVGVQGSAGQKFRVGIATDNEQGGGPGATVIDLGQTAVDVAPALFSVVTFKPLVRGFYWLIGALQNGGATRATLRSTTDVRTHRDAYVANPLGAAFADTNCVYFTGVSGAFPATWGAPSGLQAGTTAAASAPTIVAEISHPQRSV